jgi:HPt (histidine-containing phosphotransfer) domain-containing protein
MTGAEGEQQEVDGALDAGALATLRDMLGDDDEALAEVVGEFLDSAPQRLAELRSGVVSGDLELAARAAHTLKANAATFGAAGLAGRCRDLEARARTGAEPIDPGQVDAIDAEWSRVQPALRALGSGGAT